MCVLSDFGRASGQLWQTQTAEQRRKMVRARKAAQSHACIYNDLRSSGVAHAIARQEPSICGVFASAALSDVPARFRAPSTRPIMPTGRVSALSASAGRATHSTVSSPSELTCTLRARHNVSSSQIILSAGAARASDATRRTPSPALPPVAEASPAVASSDTGRGGHSTRRSTSFCPGAGAATSRDTTRRSGRAACAATSGKCPPQPNSSPMVHGRRRCRAVEVCREKPLLATSCPATAIAAA
mmetsp:Transcript_16144/g.52600  ORF Transcript_16144/g.52600 Transcript_16144/m.52600 type:complete len:243 (-) Transcript_16144:213-941(-)